MMAIVSSSVEPIPSELESEDLLRSQPDRRMAAGQASFSSRSAYRQVEAMPVERSVTGIASNALLCGRSSSVCLCNLTKPFS